MRKIFLTISMLIAASFVFTSCGAPAANNTGNKPANNANTAAPAADAAAIETEIKKMAGEMSATMAKNDVATIEKFFADNYMFVNQDGTVSTKAQRMEAIKSGSSKLESLAYDEMSVRNNPEGTGAILIGRATVKGMNMGKPTDGQYRFTQVWSKSKDGWKLVSGQITLIAAAAPAKADDKKADEKKADAKPAAPANK